MEFNWKVILGPEMLVNVNHLLERLKVEGMSASVDIENTHVQAKIIEYQPGRSAIEIEIFQKPAQETLLDNCPKCNEPRNGAFNGKTCDSCGYPHD